MRTSRLLPLLLLGCSTTPSRSDLPIENAGKLAEGLYRSAQPGPKDLRLLKERGFKTIVNLRAHHSEKAEAEALGLRAVEIPLQADLVSTPPTDAEIRRFFEVVLDPAARPLLFHCATGCDRTGLMAALYRIEIDGWSNDSAVNEMQQFGYHDYYRDLIAFARRYQPRGYAPKRLLIVAPAKWLPALDAFRRHKQVSLRTDVVALETALASPGVDDAEKLKRFLYDEWKRVPTGYVLLVGDADVMPVRFMVLDRVTPAAFDYAFYPSDLYYADLAKADGAFEDWNANKEGFHAGYFGEVRGEKIKTDPINFDRIDYRADVALGRWPVSTEEELKIVIAKSIAFETSPPSRRAGFFVVDGWVDARPLVDGVAKKLPEGWTAERRFYGGKTPPPDEKELLALVNDGAGLLCHTGHGSDWSWEHCLSTDSISRMNRAAILVSIGCSTARFATLPPYEAYRDVDGRDHAGTNAKELFKEPPPPPAVYQMGAHNPTGLGEQLLRKGPTGAVAYIGCNTGSQPCALTLLEGFIGALGEAKQPRLGDLWSAAIAFYHEKEKLATLKPDDGWYPPSIFFQGMKFMLFGDPSLRLPR